MPQLIPRTTLVAALAITTLSAHAQNGGDIAAGHSFAHEACSACHVVETEQQRLPRRIFIGPAFRNCKRRSENPSVRRPGSPVAPE